MKHRFDQVRSVHNKVTYYSTLVAVSRLILHCTTIFCINTKKTLADVRMMILEVDCVNPVCFSIQSDTHLGTFERRTKLVITDWEEEKVA